MPSKVILIDSDQIPQLSADDVVLIDVKITTCSMQIRTFQRYSIDLRNQIDNFLFFCPNKKILLLDDLHYWSFEGRNYNSLKKYCFNNRISGVITHVDFTNEVGIITKFLSPIKVSSATWYFDPKVFNDWGGKLPKIYDIIFYGAVSKRHYPLRRRLKKLFSTPRFQNNFRIKIIEYNRGINGKRLSKLINQSWLGVSTKSQYDYLLKKYFEIPASKCFLIGNMATQGLSMFDSNFYLKITKKMSDDQIYDAISKILQDKKALERKIAKNYELVHSQFTKNEVFKKIKSICHQMPEFSELK